MLLIPVVYDDTDDTEDKDTLRYTTKRRGGLGLKDIKTTERNGSVIRVMGRNTQGFHLMNLDAGDTLVAVKRIPKIDGTAESNGDEAFTEPVT